MRELSSHPFGASNGRSSGIGDHSVGFANNNAYGRY
jgi:hypothetical protein